MHYLRPDYTQGKNNNKNQMLQKEEWFRSIVTREDKFWKKIEEVKEFIEKEIKGAVKRREKDQK